MRRLCILALLLAITLFASAENLPQPEGWVNDFANIVSADYRNKLTALIQGVEEKTSSEIAVVTIESIAPYGEQEYARLLFDRWRPGKKGKDNGVLVLLALKERRWRIETGYGVEGVLPDGLCGEIGRRYMVPSFTAGRYGEGLYLGVEAISRALLGEISTADLKDKRERDRREEIPWPFYAFWVWIIFSTSLAAPLAGGVFIFIFFGLTAFFISFWFGIFCVVAYLFSLSVRWYYWRKIPPDERRPFHKAQQYHDRAYFPIWIGPGGFRGGSGGGGFGGFGGGGGGGGGAGGGF